MAIEYLGLSEINGPLIVLEGKHIASNQLDNFIEPALRGKQIQKLVAAGNKIRPHICHIPALQVPQVFIFMRNARI